MRTELNFTLIFNGFLKEVFLFVLLTLEDTAIAIPQSEGYLSVSSTQDLGPWVQNLGRQERESTSLASD